MGAARGGVVVALALAVLLVVALRLAPAVPGRRCRHGRALVGRDGGEDALLGGAGAATGAGAAGAATGGGVGSAGGAVAGAGDGSVGGLGVTATGWAAGAGVAKRRRGRAGARASPPRASTRRGGSARPFAAA